MARWSCVSLYLGAIVAANFAVASFGQAALPFTAFVLIPFDLVTRDILHEEWRGRKLWTKMALLILTGSALTAALSWDARRIALASALAFCASGLVNAGVYAIADKLHRFKKMNISNFFAAITDSLVFPFVAFTSVDSWLCLTQAGSKFAGGLFWSFIFLRLLLRRNNASR